MNEYIFLTKESRPQFIGKGYGMDAEDAYYNMVNIIESIIPDATIDKSSDVVAICATDNATHINAKCSIILNYIDEK